MTTGRSAVVDVCLDPGVPVFGCKGCSVHVQEVLRELMRRADAVDLVTARTGGRPPDDVSGVVVHDLGRMSSTDLAERERLLVGADGDGAERVRDLVADHLHAGRDVTVYQRYSLWSCEVMEAARDAGVPGVLEINAPLVEEQARHRGLVDRDGATERTVRAVRAAAFPYAVSGPVARWASDLCGRRVAVVPNGVDPDRFAARPVRDTDELVIAFVGTFRPWHGVDLLLDAVARLAHEPGRPLRLLLVGDGPLRDDALRRAARLGIDVEAPGPVGPEQVPALLAGADIAVAPYPVGDVYFSPLKVMEYLAAGLPTVAGAVTDLPRLFTDGRELLLVQPGDSNALADALRRLRADALLRERLSLRGAAAVRERHTWSAVVDRVLDAAAPTRRGAA